MGTYSEPKHSDRACPKCKEKQDADHRSCVKAYGSVTYQVWESSCGGYEDEHYTCNACKYDWWIDGIDS